MKDKPTSGNEGEGNRTAARTYDREATRFVAEGKVAPAAAAARAQVEADPGGAKADEEAAKRGPRAGFLGDILERHIPLTARVKRVVARVRSFVTRR